MTISSVGAAGSGFGNYCTTAITSTKKSDREKAAIDERTSSAIEQKGLETEEKLERYDQLYSEGLMTDTEYQYARVKAQAAQMLYAATMNAIATVQKGDVEINLPREY